MRKSESGSDLGFCFWPFRLFFGAAVDRREQGPPRGRMEAARRGRGGEDVTSGPFDVANGPFSLSRALAEVHVERPAVDLDQLDVAVRPRQARKRNKAGYAAPSPMPPISPKRCPTTLARLPVPCARHLSASSCAKTSSPSVSLGAKSWVTG